MTVLWSVVSKRDLSPAASKLFTLFCPLDAMQYATVALKMRRLSRSSVLCGRPEIGLRLGGNPFVYCRQYQSNAFNMRTKSLK